MIMSSVFVNWHLLKLSSYPPTELVKQKLEVLICHEKGLHFKRMTARGLESRRKLFS